MVFDLFLFRDCVCSAVLGFRCKSPFIWRRVCEVKSRGISRRSMHKKSNVGKNVAFYLAKDAGLNKL